MKLKRNRAKCLKCGEIIESTHRHDFVTCSCGNLSVDGGLDYTRRGYRDGEDSYEDLNEYERETIEELFEGYEGEYESPLTELQKLYQAARNLDVAEAMRLAQKAETDEERKFYENIADMNLRRAQKETL